MIKVLVYNEPTTIINASTDMVDFYFDDFTDRKCLDFIETCLENDKSIEIFSINAEKKEQKWEKVLYFIVVFLMQFVN